MHTSCCSVRRGSFAHRDRPRPFLLANHRVYAVAFCFIREEQTRSATREVVCASTVRLGSLAAGNLMHYSNS
jgi:hypothetical protein